MKKPTYDTTCYELAEAFLMDVYHLHTVKRRDELAALIQQTIEDYLEYEHDNYDGAPP